MIGRYKQFVQFKHNIKILVDYQNYFKSYASFDFFT